MVLRAVEAGFATLVVVALLAALTSGWFTAGAKRFSDWYASQVNDLLTVTVVSTTVTLPDVSREDLPLPRNDAPALSAPGGTAGATPGKGTN